MKCKKGYLVKREKPLTDIERDKVMQSKINTAKKNLIKIREKREEI